MHVSRRDSGWPRLTLREILIVVTVLAGLYGFHLFRGDRESLLGAVFATPVVLVALLIWRTVRQSHEAGNAFLRVFIDAYLGAAIGTIAGAVLGIFLSLLDVSDIVFPMFLGVFFGAIAGNIVGLCLGRYRPKRTIKGDS